MVGDDNESEYKEFAFTFFSPVEMPREPATLKEALESSDAEEWKKAKESELKSIEENGSWEMLELQEGRKAITSKWLFKIKRTLSCFAAAVPRFASMLLAPEGDPDAPDIPTQRSYAEAITVPPSWANIVDGMWIFRGVNYFQTFSPTPKMTTLQVLLHVAAQRDYELHSLDFSTTFLQGSLHEEIWMRRPPCFTGSFSADTQWSLRRPVYSLCQAPREWHNTLTTTLVAMEFTPSTADLSLFLRTNTSLPPFNILVYVHDLVLASADTKARTLVKSELQKRHTCNEYLHETTQ
ncbi:unnamed protein product [Closterium sp. NIES-53]